MRYKGSFTVEAALIMPMILGVIVLFIYIAMFAHDRCALEYICQSACAGAVYEPECSKAAHRTADLRLENALILEWDTEVEVTEEGDLLILTVKARVPLFDRVFTHTAKAYKHFYPKY